MQSITSTLTAAATAAAMYETNPVTAALGLAIQIAVSALAVSGSMIATQQIETARMMNLISIMQLQDAKAQIKGMVNMI